MGTPVPLEQPDLDNDKVYMVFVDPYQDMTPATGCNQEYLGRFSCCQTGERIQIWRDSDFECTEIFDPAIELCRRTGFSSQRLVAIHGPYDTVLECQAEL